MSVFLAGAGGIATLGGLGTLAYGIQNDDKRCKWGGAALAAIGLTGTLYGAYQLIQNRLSVKLEGRVLKFSENAKQITISNCPELKDVHLTQLAQFKNLTSLKLDNCPNVTAEGLLKLKTCPKLNYLHLRNGSVALKEIPSDLVQFLVNNQKPDTWKPGIAYRFKAVEVETASEGFKKI